LLATGYHKVYDRRPATLGPFQAMGRDLPPGSKVLIHENHLHLGLAAMSVNDWTRWQAGLRYDRFATPRALWTELRAMGVTLISWVQHSTREADTLAGDLAFHDFARQYTVEQRAYEGWTLGRLADVPPPDESPVVAMLNCAGSYPHGLYHLSDLANLAAQPFEPERSPDQAGDLVAKADLVVWDTFCRHLQPAALQTQFQELVRRNTVALLGRRSGSPLRH
jgi:hypothetical protein